MFSTISMAQAELTSYLDTHNITRTSLVDHPEVFTVDAMMPYLQDVEGLVSKNLFLKDKKKKLFLLTALHSQDIDLAKIAKKVGASGGLRFADEAIMIEKLSVAQGCCTPLAIYKDINKDVRLIVDSRFLEEGAVVHAHPMVNTATMGLKAEELKKFFDSTGHEPILLNFGDL